MDSSQPTTATGSPTSGWRNELLDTLDRARLRGADAGAAGDDPPPARRARPRRPGGDRHRQDGGVRPAVAALARLSAAAARRRRALVLVPTRELAMQVSEAIFKYGRELGVKVVPVYGGQPIFRQLQSLDRGVHVVVGTPGRVLDHLGRGSLDRRRHPHRRARRGRRDARHGLRRGHRDDPRRAARRSARRCCSRRRCRRASPASPSDSSAIRCASPSAARRAPTAPALITQRAYVVQRAHKAAALGRILDIETPEAALVFCRTRTEVDMLTETMNGRGYRAEACTAAWTRRSATA